MIERIIPGTNFKIQSNPDLISEGIINHQASLLLNNAQIIALPTTPLDFLAAPGPNKILVPRSAILIVNQAISYTGNTNERFALLFENGSQSGIRGWGLASFDNNLDVAFDVNDGSFTDLA